MKSSKKEKVVIAIIALSFVACSCIGMIGYHIEQQRIVAEEQARIEEELRIAEENRVLEFQKVQFAALQFVSEVKINWVDYLDENQINQIDRLHETIEDAMYEEELSEPIAKANEIIEAAKETKTIMEEQAAAEAEAAAAQQYYNSYSYSNNYSENSNGLTKSGGVNYYNDRKETWYSSNVLYHYRTPEWSVDEYGVYRDSDGYVVVAASDLEQGSEVDTSFGVGKVYDSGCAAGTTDIYTNW